ncbi:sel1 repeat family protein [Ruegeria sp. R13_0]|uniref:sel1 repeat family protein n=1 Tax=Ruegeria sp. R13_0 TaxID=2821099 RepID=UPI001ADBB46E|nr:sel1 repeat family protein [Ruegeria sp. R13_0]MBO9434871.1 sel1 repeat family protein [Ruegeria sp. R13_0]
MIRIAIALLFLGTAASAQTVEDEYGTLNPQDTGFGRVMSNIDNGVTDMTTCATGYYITKSGRHEMARKLFENCANAGYTGAMTWMGQLDNNGLGGDYDPDAAAAWDKRAADLGDPVGKFNYGLNLLRGHGVAQDPELGRAYVDEAASDGLKIAKRLQESGYDPNEVTPDADEWKYAPLF